MDAREALDLRIENLYQRFARYGLRASRPHPGEHRSEVDPFQAFDVRTIPAKSLRLLPYNFVSTSGALVDFKRLLPRFLELFVASGAIDGEQVCRELREGSWHSWPADEVQSIAEFFQALWRFVLSLGAEGEAQIVLRAILQLEDDLSSYLSAWLNVRTERSYLELSEVVLKCEWETAIEPDRRTGDPQRQEQCTQVVSWIMGDEVREFLESGFFATDNALISDACEALLRMRMANSGRGASD